MNQQAGLPPHTLDVDKSVFIHHFFDTIEQVSNYDPTADCILIFEQVTGNSISDTIELIDFYGTGSVSSLRYS